MPSFPNHGSVTICEISRELLTTETFSEDKCRDTYGKILGTIFKPFEFHPDQLNADSNRLVEQVDRPGIVNSLRHFLGDTIHRVFSPSNVNLLPRSGFQGVSWHHKKLIVAIISGQNEVIIHDYENSDGKDSCILTCECQREVNALEWRPKCGMSIAIACKGGICIWSASYPENPAFIRSGASAYVGTLSRGSGTRWTLVDFLRSQNDEQITSLSWCPSGRLLASASHDTSSFTIWDVSQGTGTPIRRGLGGISVLKWSPTGDYFFNGKFDGTFYLWETNTWTSDTWSSTVGHVSGAVWDPEGSMLLTSFTGSSTLASLHFSSKPPYLDAHLLPLEFPEIVSLTGSESIERIAWDGSGGRLAVSYKGGNDEYKDLIAIFDVKRSPLISKSLIGFIRGPGEASMPISFAFHNKFKQGPLLSVCWSTGFCCAYPLLFRS